MKGKTDLIAVTLLVALTAVMVGSIVSGSGGFEQGLERHLVGER